MKFIQKRKQAFTMIELMGVVIIVGVIATVTISVTNNSIRNSKEKLYVEQVDRIEKGVKKWALQNTARLPMDASGVVFFSVETLKEEGIVDSDTIVDPRTDDELKGCVTIKYESLYNQYNYEYLDSDCLAVSDIYKPVIIVTGGENQTVEVNSNYKIPTATAIDYTGTDLKVSGPIIKKGSEVQTSIDLSTVGDTYTLTYQATDERLGLTQVKEITLNVVDTIAPLIVVNDSAVGYTLNLEGDSFFEIPTAIVTDNSCGQTGTETTVNGCNSTLTPIITSSVLPNIPGNYDITYRAEDMSGNVKFFIVTVIIGDSTPPETPTFAIKYNNSTGTTYDEKWTNANVWIGDLLTTDSGSGIDKYQYAVDCTGTWIDVTSKTYSTDVDEQICIRALDNVGNASTPTRLISIKVDKTAPVCTTSGGNSAWTNGSRTIIGTCTSDAGSGCNPSVIPSQTYSSEINTTTANPGVGLIEDNAGNTASCPANQTVRIDKTAPTCSASSGGSTAWTNSYVTITGTCTDLGGSGCGGTTISTTYSTEVNTTTASAGSGILTDNAGNSANVTCPANQTVRIDKTNPTCVSSGGSTAWTNTSRTLTGTCSDLGGSGCSGNISKLFNTEINTTTASPGTVTDEAGNSTACPANQTVRIDKTNPTCVSSGGNTAWTNTSRTLTGTCSDTGGSGCSGNISKLFDTEINTTTASPGNITDAAGNSISCPANQTVRIDKTNPTCASSGGSTAWTNGSRTLTGTCSDTGGSGCSGNASQVFNTEVNTTTASPGTVTDAAGNSIACPANQTVKIDKTAPTCSASSGGSTTWTNGSRTLTGTCSDTGGSGCIATTISTTYSTQINTTTASAGSGTYFDNAGNSASVSCPSNQTVRIDKTNPTCASSGGSTAWTNGSRTIIGTCSDTGGSGCSGNASAVYSTQTDITNAGPGSVTDVAGNSITCPANQTVRIDKTNPTCASSGGSTAWTNGSRTIIGTCSDTGGSGCVGNASTEYSTQMNITNAGPGTVADTAGNSITCPTNQTVRIDKTAPTCAASGGSSTCAVSRTIIGTCSDTGGSGCVGNSSTTYSTTQNNSVSASNVSDNAGNTSTTCLPLQTVNISAGLPTVSYVSSTGIGTTSQTVNISYTSDGCATITGIQYRQTSTGTIYSFGSVSTSLVFNTPRNTTDMQIRVVDSLGRYSSWITGITVNVITTPLCDVGQKECNGSCIPSTHRCCEVGYKDCYGVCTPAAQVCTNNPCGALTKWCGYECGCIANRLDCITICGGGGVEN